MEVLFDDDLERLDAEREFCMGLAASIVKAYRKRVFVIRHVSDERQLYAYRSLHFEKLKGKRQHQCSMRLNDQYRLILELEGNGQDKKVRIVGIEDYH